jgi:glycosyltransferase involved in cell wall biosynthesis
MTELSVVLISKNQEWNIDRLIESVMRETPQVSSSEIALVDSASKDRTTEIAANYPITVLKLYPDQRLTAAAGRYVGYKQTKGDLVLFLDGDMELCQGWLAQALSVMHTMSEVAVVCGQVIDRPITFQMPIEEYLKSLDTGAAAVYVQQGGGAALFRRSVLEQVGSFNPYLYSDEEPELCLRIRHAGYRILRLPRPIAIHYTAPAEDLSTFLCKRRGNLWFGYGQNIRYFFGSPLLWPYIQERGWVVAPALTLGIGILALAVSGLTGQWVWFALWVALLIMLTIAIAIRKRSLKRALLTLLRRLFILDGTLRGLLLKPYDPAGYPGNYDVIQ